jgi:hypothetical protein
MATIEIHVSKDSLRKGDFDGAKCGNPQLRRH